MERSSKYIYRSLLNFFLLVLIIQSLHGFWALPTYDFTYLIILTVILTIGETLECHGWVAFVIGFFMMDIWPDWFFLVMALMFLKNRKKTTVLSLSLKIFPHRDSKITAKIGI